jgi:hypothetical protein
MWSVGAAIPELRELARDRKTRVIHGLEHATANLLQVAGRTVHGGLTHAGFFELHVTNEGKAEEQAKTVRRAVQSAIRRVRHGDERLAYHPQCGTSFLVMAVILSLMALASGVIGFFMRVAPGTLLAIAGIYAAIIFFAARPLGLLAQRFLTVSTAFRSARILRMVRTLTHEGSRACFDVYLHVRDR